MGGWGSLGAAVGGAVGKAVAPPASPIGNVVGRAIQAAPSHSVGSSVGYGLSRATPQHIAAATGNVTGNALNAQAQAKSAALQSLVASGLLRDAAHPINPGLTRDATAGFDPAAVITFPATALGKIGHIAGNFGKDVINLPGDLLKGGEQLGSSFVHDIGHIFSGDTPLAGSGGHPLFGETATNLENAAKGSVVGTLVDKGPGAAWDAIQHHPFNAATEVLGELGLAGRLAGTVGRSGLVGDRLAQAASTARDPLNVVPGQEPMIQHYSPSVLTKAAQVVGEKIPAAQYIRMDQPRKLSAVTTKNSKFIRPTLISQRQKLMNRPVDLTAADSRIVGANAHVDTVKQFSDMIKTAGKPGRDVLPLVAMRTAATPESLYANLTSRLNDLKGVEQAHTQAIQTERALRVSQAAHGMEPPPEVLRSIRAAKLSPTGLRANLQHQSEIQKVLSSPEAQTARPDRFGGIDNTRFDPTHGPVIDHTNPADADRIARIQELLRRPGTAGEAAAAQSALDRLTSTTPVASELSSRLFKAAQPWVDQGHALDAELAHLGLRDAGQMEMRQNALFAKEHMPDVSYHPGGELSARHNAYIGHKADLRTAQSDLLKGVQASRKPSPELIAARQAERSAFLKAGNAKAREAQTRGYITGKRGADTPLTAALYKQLQNHMAKNEAAQADLAAARQATRDAESEHFTNHNENIAALNDAVADASSHMNEMKPFANERVPPGLVQNLDHGPIPLRQESIQAAMRSQGVTPGAYVRLTPDRGSTFSRLQTRLSRGGSPGPKTTYSTYDKGTYTPGVKSMLQSRLKTVMQIHQAKFFDTVIKRTGIKDPATGQPFRSAQAAHEFAHYYNQDHPEVGDLVPVNSEPKSLNADQSARVAEAQTPDEAHHSASIAAQENRLHINPEGNNQSIVLVPKTQLDRYHQWEQVNSSGGGFFSRANSIFRNSVLPFSTKWFTGNMVEATGRATLHGGQNPLNPQFWRNRALADRVMKNMPQDAQDKLAAEALGGHHMSSADRAIQEQHMAGETRDPTKLRAVADFYNRLPHAIYSVNRKLEGMFDKGLLGQHMRQHMNEFMGSWTKAVRLQKQVYEDTLSQHYADPRLAEAAGEASRDTMGQYSHFSPQMQRFVRSVAPFSPWYLNSLKFIYKQMPQEHPLLTNTLLRTSNANDAQWKAEHNVPHDDVTAGVPAGDLLSAIKEGPDQFLNVGRYTPAGAFTGGPLNYVSNMVLPQFSGAARNLIGQDAFGRPLKGPDGKPVTSDLGRGLQALNSILGGFGGPTEPLSRVFLEHGSTPYNTSKIWDPQLKPGTQHGSGWDRVWNPLFPTYLKPQLGAGGSSGPSLTTNPKSGGGSLTTNSLTGFHPGANRELHPQHAAPPWFYNGDRVGRALNPVGVVGTITGYPLVRSFHSAGEAAGNGFSPQSDRTGGVFRPIPTQIPHNKGLGLTRPNYLPTGKFGKPGFLRYV